MIELEYIEIDGLLYPNIKTGMENIKSYLGKYGILRLRYLHDYKNEMYRELLLTGKLANHCIAMDKAAFEMAERIRSDYLKAYPMPKEDSMERIRLSELAQMIAHENVMSELIYN